MNKILFPSFNLEFNLSPIAIEIGNFQIYWYAIFIVSGIILSLILMYFSNKKYNIEYEDLLEILIFVLVFGIIGARVFYVIFNFDYYLKNVSQIINIKNGGLAIFGGIIAGFITVYVLCKKKQINIFDFCDYIVPYLVLTQGIGRLGNFFNVEAYGKETTNIFRMGIETYTGYQEVHPCFLYEMIGCFIIFVFLKLIQKKQKYKGEILSWYLILYGIIRFCIESLRADSLMFFNIKISMLISLMIIVLGLLIYIKDKFCRKKQKSVV